MKNFILALTILISLFVGARSSSADSKKRPELGSIADPDDMAAANKILKEPAKDPFANIDHDLPSLPQTQRWELLLTQKAYGVSPNLRTASDLITSLNKSIEILCFADLQRTLFFDPKDNSAECKIVLKYLTALDPKNPLIACVTSGIESAECRSAYSSQITLDQLPSEGLRHYTEKTGDGQSSSYSFQQDLDVKLEAEKSSKSLREMGAELVSLKSKQGGSKEEIAANNQKISSLSNRYLALACGRYRIVVFPDQVAINDSQLPRQAITPKSRGAVRKGSLEELLQKGPFSQSIAPNNNKSAKSRFRLVNRSCLESLAFISANSPENPAVHCYRDGFTAPTCIDARRTQGKSSGPTGQTSTGEGIERF